MNSKELFTKFLDEIEQNASVNVYNLWFSQLEPVCFDEENLIIKVPMEVHRDVLSKNQTYKDLIDNALIAVTGKTYNIKYVSPNDSDYDNVVSKKEVKNEEIINEKIEVINNDWESNLNPLYTFDNFVVGESNKLAVSAAHTVAENPGTMHNPLFLYGKSGIGKTHLMHAIGNYITLNTNLKVLYTTSNEFMTDYTGISAIERGVSSINYAQKFKDKYQNVDVLIIDDIQFLVSGEGSQKEFFHTFNNLYQKNKQIIISSDRPPDEIKNIADRLKSRFMMGLPVDIYPPDLALRCKIINKKIKDTPIEDKLDEECIDYIANACTSDVRQIEGALNKLKAYIAMMVPDKIDINFVNEALKDYLKVNIFAENSITKIQKVVAEYFEVDPAEIKSQKRTANVAKARQIAMYLCRELSDETLERIGLEFGKDHSTVSAAWDKITLDLKKDIKLQTIVKDLKNKL